MTTATTDPAISQLFGVDLNGWRDALLVSIALAMSVTVRVGRSDRSAWIRTYLF